MLSEQQDFGYLRNSRDVKFEYGQAVESLFTEDILNMPNPYNRFEKLPDKARSFIKQALSRFQQAVYEEFLLALQPLACHMIRKQVLLRTINDDFSCYTIQDVIATVHLLENTGLIERRQGLQLSYYDTYLQGEKRRVIQDHRGRSIGIDTWVWTVLRG